MPANNSILEVVEKAGSPGLSSCRTGTCGSVTVFKGLIDHRDQVLTDDDERAARNTMMICVSRALAEELVLDI